MCVELDNSFSINLGGCCYVAYCIAKLLEQDGFRYSLLVFDDYYNLSDYCDLFELPDTMAHYAIMLECPDSINSEVINCFEDDFDSFYTDFEVTSDEILHYYKTHEWNTEYNIKNNKLIKDAIEKVYYEFTENLY